MDKTFLELTIVGFAVALALLYLVRNYLVSSGVLGGSKPKSCAFGAGCSGCPTKGGCSSALVSGSNRLGLKQDNLD